MGREGERDKQSGKKRAERQTHGQMERGVLGNEGWGGTARDWSGAGPFIAGQGRKTAAAGSAEWTKLSIKRGGPGAGLLHVSNLRLVPET